LKNQEVKLISQQVIISSLNRPQEKHVIANELAELQTKKKPAKKNGYLTFFWIYARRDFVLNPDFSGIVVNVHQE